MIQMFIKYRNTKKASTISINPLNAELNPICHLLALLGVHTILHVSRIRVNTYQYFQIFMKMVWEISPTQFLITRGCSRRRRVFQFINSPTDGIQISINSSSHMVDRIIANNSFRTTFSCCTLPTITIWKRAEDQQLLEFSELYTNTIPQI